MADLTVLPSSSSIVLPVLVSRAGEVAAWRFVEFFTVHIRNPHTRTAYTRAAVAFLAWCEARGISKLRFVQPVHVAGLCCKN